MKPRHCACGCGEFTKPYARTHRSLGRFAGEPAKYLKGHASGGVNTGQILKDRFWAQVARGPDDACWLWTGLMNAGYGRMKRKGQPVGAHRLAWEFTHGPTKLDVCHHCDNHRCCNPAHLFEGSHADNMKDMAKKLRSPHKLSHDAVIAIRELARIGIAQKRIATIFNINRGHISAIIAKKKRTAS